MPAGSTPDVLPLLPPLLALPLSAAHSERDCGQCACPNWMLGPPWTQHGQEVLLWKVSWRLETPGLFTAG